MLRNFISINSSYSVASLGNSIYQYCIYDIVLNNIINATSAATTLTASGNIYLSCDSAALDI